MDHHVLFVCEIYALKLKLGKTIANVLIFLNEKNSIQNQF